MDDVAEQVVMFAEDDVERRKRPPPSRTANDLDGKTWLQNSISIWSDLSKTAEEHSLKHPAMFPTQLATRLLESFTRSDQNVVLDPFCGVGATVMAAERNGKQGVGFDVSPVYIARARQRASMFPGLSEGAGDSGNGQRRLIEADARDLLEYVHPESVDFVVTSPPYWDVLLRDRTADLKDVRNYGESERDLGRVSDYREFLDSLGDVFANVLTVLKPGCYCCVVVMDLRKGGDFFPLHVDLSIKMQEVGFRFDDIIIWDRRRDYNNLRPLGHPSVFRVNKVHEYILVFQKPWS